MTMTDWNNLTNYMDTVGVTPKTFSFNKTQNFVRVTTRGNANVTYTIGSQTGTLTPGQSVSVSELITSFTLTAASGSQTIEVWSTEYGTEKVEDNGISLDDITASLASNTSQANSRAYNVIYPPVPLVGAKGNANYYKSADGKYYKDSGLTQLADDDTTAIQNIINAAQTSMGIVYFPTANYWISSTLNVTSSLFLYSDMKKGNTGLGYSKGANIRYSGTGDAIFFQSPQRTTDASKWLYACKISGIRFSSDSSTAQSGIHMDGVSESDVTDCQFNGGFLGAGMILRGASISTIRNNNFSSNVVGLQLIATSQTTYSPISMINIENNNFWDNSTAHIQTNTLDIINIKGNQFEWAQQSILVTNDNTEPASGMTIVASNITNNNFLCSNTTKYPNPRALVVKSTVASNIIYINGLNFRQNKIYMNGATYAIEFLKNGNTYGGSSARRIVIQDNEIWGTSTASINSDSGLFAFVLGNNDCQTGYSNGVTATEITGTYIKSGINPYWDYVQVNGALRLGTAVSTTPALGDLRVQTNSLSIRFYDGTAERVVPTVLTGTAAPTTTPNYVGQKFIDTTNKKSYEAMGTTSSADWVVLN